MYGHIDLLKHYLSILPETDYRDFIEETMTDVIYDAFKHGHCEVAEYLMSLTSLTQKYPQIPIL